MEWRGQFVSLETAGPTPFPLLDAFETAAAEQVQRWLSAALLAALAASSLLFAGTAVSSTGDLRFEVVRFPVPPVVTPLTAPAAESDLLTPAVDSPSRTAVDRIALAQWFAQPLEHMRSVQGALIAFLVEEAGAVAAASVEAPTAPPAPPAPPAPAAAAAPSSPPPAAPAPPAQPAPTQPSQAAAPAAAPVATPAAAPPAQPAPTQPSQAAAPAAAPVATPAAAPAPAVVAPAASGATAPSTPRAALFTEAMNTQRTSGGLPALVLDPTLNAIALQRGKDMQDHGYFAHVSPTGDSWLTLLTASGMGVKGGGENLARVSGDVHRSVDVAITKLMESPTHRANILHGSYTHTGVAAVTDEQGVTVFVTIFIVR